MACHRHTVPSPDPARRARQALVRHRAEGHSFEVAWAAALHTATRGLAPTPAGEWRCALLDTEWAWRDAYTGQGCVIALFSSESDGGERAAA
jgi:hypothetical protein